MLPPYRNKHELNYPKFFADFSKGFDGPIQMLSGVGGAYLSSNSGFSLGYNREGKANDIDALFQHGCSDIRSQLGIPKHDGNDGMFPSFYIESCSSHLLSKVACILLQFLT